MMTARVIYYYIRRRIPPCHPEHSEGSLPPYVRLPQRNLPSRLRKIPIRFSEAMAMNRTPKLGENKPSPLLCLRLGTVAICTRLLPQSFEKKSCRSALEAIYR